jgi:hypothetical protein
MTDIAIFNAELSTQNYITSQYSNAAKRRSNILLCRNSALKMVISVTVWYRKKGGNIWDDDEVRFVLDQHAELDLYSVS